MKQVMAKDAETKSPDIAAENIEHLKTLFPEAFAEGKLDFEVLKQLLGGTVEEREEKYGLNWQVRDEIERLKTIHFLGECVSDTTTNTITNWK